MFSCWYFFTTSDAHDLVAKFHEQRTLERLGEEISSHLFCRSINNKKLTVVNFFFHSKETNIDMASSLTQLTLLGEQDGGLIVLLNHSRLQLESLGFQEMAEPSDDVHTFSKGDEFRFTGRLGYQLLLHGLAKNSTATKGDEDASVRLPIHVNTKSSIDRGQELINTCRR